MHRPLAARLYLLPLFLFGVLFPDITGVGRRERKVGPKPKINGTRDWLIDPKGFSETPRHGAH